MTKQFVRDLSDKDEVNTVFLASNKSVLTDKKGRPYMSVNLLDVSGAINARAWDRTDKLALQFQAGDFVVVKGHVQVFQNKKQIVLRDISKAEVGQYEVCEIVKSSHQSPEKMFEELIGYVEKLEDKFIKDLLMNSLNDPVIKEKLMDAPAAKTIHHAYMGGLLEHILSISKTMLFLVTNYPYLKIDLLLFGAIYHDLGKIWELEIDQGIKYTDKGRLVGHMGIALEMLDQKTADIEGFPESLKDICKHIVLSHHNRLEYGSPKRPKIIEAVVVAMIDDLDSKLNTLNNFIEGELSSGDSNWTQYHTGFDRYFFLEAYKEHNM